MIRVFAGFVFSLLQSLTVSLLTHRPKKLYQDAWNKDKTNITIPSDMPGMLQAPINALQISNKFYQKDWNETKQKGYDFKADAIEIKQAKDSRDISSEQPLCRDAWEREKANVNVPADTPGMLQSKINAVQISDKHCNQA
ncbi:nebulin-like [Canis lupus familiaris]|uniref:nebulin-like n=1 Tax=Canis lupus familiaris TaxID=9615 RepID=UPI0018F283E9|nr:nebulin-like [Canis lupus familiaris]